MLSSNLKFRRMLLSSIDILLALLLFYAINNPSEASDCAFNGVIPKVRNISKIGDDSYNIPGLSHVPVDGFKEVEVWLQTLAPGCSSPIHKNTCQEIFVFLKGTATIFLASDSGLEYPGAPRELPIFANSTIHIPSGDVHQLMNTNENQDLQYIAINIKSRPIEILAYDDWFTPHNAAKKFPIGWVNKGCQTLQSKDEL